MKFHEIIITILLLAVACTSATQKKETPTARAPERKPKFRIAVLDL